MEFRDIKIDIVKGICIILMVVGHSGVPKIMHDAIYMFHMPCFFIVSGWLFKEKYLYSVWKFVKRRINMLWTPYVKWGIIYLLLSNVFIVLYFVNSPFLTIEDYIHKGLNIITMRGTHILLGGLWFVESLFVGSIVSILWYKFVGNKLKSIITGILVFMICAFATCHYDIAIPYLNTRTLMGIAYFMVGTLLSRIQITTLTIKPFLFIGAMISLVVGMICIMPVELIYINSMQIVPYFITSTIISYALIVACYIWIPPNIIVKWISTMGRRSLDILIFHFLVFKVVSLIKIWHYGLPIERLSDFPIVGDDNRVYWIVFVVAGISGSLLFAKVVMSIRKNLNGLVRKYLYSNAK